jgi:hypothetical protein
MFCPICQTATRPTPTDSGGRSIDINPLKCAACDYEDPKVVEPVDPMKSPRTNAWLNGQLLALEGCTD